MSWAILSREKTSMMWIYYLFDAKFESWCKSSATQSLNLDKSGNFTGGFSRLTVEYASVTILRNSVNNILDGSDWPRHQSRMSFFNPFPDQCPNCSCNFRTSFSVSSFVVIVAKMTASTFRLSKRWLLEDSSKRKKRQRTNADDGSHVQQSCFAD